MAKEKDNRFVGDATDIEILDKEEELNFPQCIVCQHLIDAEAETCKAFPNGIPEKFFLGDKAHDKPIKGFVFEPIAEVLVETE